MKNLDTSQISFILALISNVIKNWSRVKCLIKPYFSSPVFSIHISSRPEVFCKKGVFRNFAKFTGKELRQSLFFNNVADFRPAALLKKEALAQVFPCEFCEISKNTFLQNTSSGSLNSSMSYKIIQLSHTVYILFKNNVLQSHNCYLL